MAVVRHLEPKTIDTTSKHGDTECGYAIGVDDQGKPFLQLETYGSTTRAIPNKVSQTLRFSSEAMSELREIINQHID